MKKKIWCTVLAVFIIVTAIAFILLQPYLNTAIALGKAAKADSAEFHVEVCLNADTLSENEKGLINTLEWIFQVKEEDLLNLCFAGDKSENETTVTVYCNAVEHPLTEVYYGQNQRTVNIKMFYEAIEKSLPDKLWILKTLLPEWNLEEETVSFEQLETLGIDMEALVPFGKESDFETPSTIQCIYLLFQLEREKDENGDIWFLGDYEGYSIRFCAKEKEDSTVILLRGEAIGENQKIENFEADFTSGL